MMLLKLIPRKYLYVTLRNLNTYLPGLLYPFTTQYNTGYFGRYSKKSGTNTPHPPRDPPENYQPKALTHEAFEGPENVEPRVFRPMKKTEVLGPNAAKENVYKNPEYYSYHRYSHVDLFMNSMRIRKERATRGPEFDEMRKKQAKKKPNCPKKETAKDGRADRKKQDIDCRPDKRERSPKCLVHKKEPVSALACIPDKTKNCKTDKKEAAKDCKSAIVVKKETKLECKTVKKEVSKDCKPDKKATSTECKTVKKESSLQCKPAKTDRSSKCSTNKKESVNDCETDKKAPSNDCKSDQKETPGGCKNDTKKK